MTASFAGKVALVTGAASGIGRATAQLLARRGATVVGADIDTAGGALRALDVTKGDAWRDAVAAVQKQHGTLHVLVHCAGAARLKGAPQEPDVVSEETWRGLHAVNLDSLVMGVRAALPALRAAGQGSIVAVSSLAALRGWPSATAYASAKMALLQYVQTVARFCADSGWAIRCNAVVPGPIDTPMMGSPGRHGRPGDPWVAEVPLRRYGAAEEVAAAIAFLASDEASYITGVGLPVDGGISAGVAA